MRETRRGTRLHGRVPFVIAMLALLAGIAGLPDPVVGQSDNADAALVATQTSCSAPAWTSGGFYNQGDVVSHNGHEWRASSWLWPGVEPGVSGTPPWWVPWEDLGSCGGSTTTTTTTPGSTSTTSTPGSTTTTTVPSGESIEEHFGARGPWAVTTGTASAPGTPGVTLYHPTSLGEGGVDHPILTWANGTGLSCEQDAAYKTHLASWGYAVVCPNSSWTGSGEEMWAAAQWLVGQDDNPSSVFFDQLDTANVGAYGISQGASGAVNATILSNGAITSIVGIALTDPWVHIWGPPPDMSQVDDPLFLISGTADGLISQEQQQVYYDQVPGPATKAALVGVAHDQGYEASIPYVTAWFRYTLEGDQFARSAFVATDGNPPEIDTDSAWTNQAQKNLP